VSAFNNSSVASENPDHVINSDLVGIWFALEHFDKVFYCIERSIEKRMGPVGFFLEYPVFKKLKLDPRFKEVRKKAGLE